MATKKKSGTKTSSAKARRETPTGASLRTADKPRTKSEIMGVLADTTGLTKKEIHGIFSALGNLIGMDIGKRGPGIFTLPGLMKIKKVTKPATKARKGVNPFTGEEVNIKAKPARNVVRVRPLKALREMVA